MNHRILLVVLGGVLAGSGLRVCAQPLLNARAVALGAYDAMVNDSRSFAANPAGMVGMRDWDFNSSTYRATSQGGSGFVFYGFSLGKRFFDQNAIAVQYAPGALLEFGLPSAVAISGLTEANKKISYSEPVAAGYAHRFDDRFSVGMGWRLRTETVNDPQFQIQIQDSSITAIPNQFTRNVWFGDLGLTWNPLERLTVSAVGRGLVDFRSGSFPVEFEPYYLPIDARGELGLAVDLPGAVTVAAEGSTDKEGALGCEWSPGFDLAVRGGVYMSSVEHPFVYAVSLGAGWSYEFVEIDAGIIHFLSEAGRSTSLEATKFDASMIKDVMLNPFTRDRLALSVKAVFGNIREVLARIESVDISGGVYPSEYEALAYRPIGTVRVRNVSRKPIQVRASLFVDRVMDAPTETQPQYVPPGAVAEIPLTAVFNDRIRSVKSLSIRDADVGISASRAGEYDDKAQARVLIHGRNDWDGNIASLRYFVTPGDADVIRVSRELLLERSDSLRNVPRELLPFRKARILFDGFAGKLLYVNDPKMGGDYVQYPSETLSMRGGDCDDMTVCFASLLSSIGISTAFVDVVPPAHPENSHVYLLFDTGLDPRYGNSISENPKRYVIRKTRSGTETIWIPVESTVITRGFETAWEKGAQEHLDNVEVGLGLLKGWVHIVDVY